MPLRTLPPLKPFWTTYNDDKVVRLYQGNVTKVLAGLPAQSVHMTVCSPPYWNLRDYGTGLWTGGDGSCDHVEVYAENVHRSSTLGPTAKQRASGDYSREHPATNAAFKSKIKQYKDVCAKCGARRIDLQIGQEPSPDCGTQGKAQCGACFVCSLVAAFRGVYRVLRDDGTLWLNLGSSYGGGNRQMIATPWLVALALQTDGWILRQDIIWSKPDPMPESVKNRCTKSHEYIFLFAKKSGYYYDAEAIKEAMESEADGMDLYEAKKTIINHEKVAIPGSSLDTEEQPFHRQNAYPPNGKRNKRSVWRVSAGGGYSGAHFATFPERLIRDCILAGTSAKGCCSACGTPWKRIVKETQLKRERPNEFVKRTGEDGTGNSCNNTVAGVFVETVGWEPTCECIGGIEIGEDGNTEHPMPPVPIPCTVLDPFVGSGTTCITSLAHGRNSIGIDLSEEYLRKHAVRRVRGRLVKLGKTALLPPLPKPPPTVLNGHKFYS